ncbi:uncharacterized protein LOC136092096 [Hydra vulgaris]|uniref:Uncharacterized protein LOC136092096 n=1 Tax=Hydra vulgaris TaxID=6087 RepID=A0ABM4DMU2_HYDVU
MLKRNCKFKNELLKNYPFVKNISGEDNKVVCHCSTELSVAHGGQANIISHIKYAKHKAGYSAAACVQREKLIQEIHDYFSQDAKKLPLVLYGMSGVGKTKTARKYSEIYSSFFKNIVWIDAACGKLQTSIRNRCLILGLTVHNSKGDFNIEVVVKKVHNYYINGKTLYIFDNVDDVSVKNFEMYISRKPNSFTLITSQWRGWSNNVNKMFVDVFSYEDGFAYVKNNIKEYANENIKNLIKKLGYHSFAITQAIKYINIHKISIKKYLNLYKQKPLEILDTDNFPSEVKSKSTIKAINLVLLKLKETNLIPLELLNCLSHCDGQNISKEFIIQILNQMKKAMNI